MKVDNLESNKDDTEQFNATEPTAKTKHKNETLHAVKCRKRSVISVISTRLYLSI